MAWSRRAGILLHPTSLPGPEGIGTLGPEAYRFVDTLSEAGMRLWQVLPLGPTGYGDSPYAAVSAFAGNPMLISLHALVDQGVVDPDAVRPPERFSEDIVEYGPVAVWKMSVLRAAFDRARQVSAPGFLAFVDANASWLHEFALFAALKQEHGGAPWIEWEPELRMRDPAALAAARERLRDDIVFHQWLQYVFHTQWSALKARANSRDIKIVGDIPIFVAYDSADVWSRQELFKLDESGVPTVVTGVPPDYFSETGQLWGNPHYRWDVMASQGFSWWIERFRAMSGLVDVVRLDHFRGFAGAWEVPAGETTAIRGEWVPGPGGALFAALREAVPSLEIIAEDLGVITEDVVALREAFGLPGMYILQFAFSTDAHDPGLPHNYVDNSVVYTGTHDNDTTIGWWESSPEVDRRRVLNYVQTTGLDIAWDLIRLAFASVSVYAVVPLQDVLRLGTKARMNLPGRAEGNWRWRFRDGDLTRTQVEGLRALASVYGRTRETPRTGSGPEGQGA